MKAIGNDKSKSNGDEMKKNKESIDDKANIRKRTEKKMYDKKVSVNGNIPPDVKNISHDIEVHQIELESQNEEVRAIQIELDEAREKYFNLYNLAPVGYLTINDKCIITEANLTVTNMFGVEKARFVLQPLSRFIFKEDQDIFYLHQKELLESSAIQRCELRMKAKDGMVFWAELTSVLVNGCKGNVCSSITISNITERKFAVEAIRSERKHLIDLMEMLPAYLILLSEDYHISYANSFFAKRFGKPNGKRCHEHIFGYDTPCDNCETHNVFETKEPHQWEWKGPDEREYEIHDFPYTDSNGSNLILEMGMDITDRKIADEKVRKAYAYNRSLIEASLDPFVAIGQNGQITDLNIATEYVTGYKRSELIGTDFSDYFTEPALAHVAYRRTFNEGSMRDYPLEIRHLDGHTIPVMFNASVYRDELGNIIGVFADARDITERKVTESMLQSQTERLQTLSHRLIEMQESERRSLARELHDQMGQSLTALKINMTSIQESLHNSDVSVDLEINIHTVDQLLKDVRSLSLRLRPSTLDDFGLVTALQMLIDQFAKQFRIEFAFYNFEVDERFPAVLEITMYRVVQESLTNIIKYAEANLISVKLWKHLDVLHLSVIDDGKGFDLHEAFDKAERGMSMGITGMEERCNLIRGKFEIQSGPKSGTSIHAWFPITELIDAQ